MRFLLNLFASDFPAVLPLNYQYPISAVIYRILQQADKDYAHFLHDTGYRQSEHSLKSFKLFTFSDIRTPFKIEGDRMRLRTPEAELTVSFHLPHAAETFIKGLFMDQEIEIADGKSKSRFRINQVQSIPTGLTDAPVQEVLLQPLSPVVCGRKNEQGNYDFLSPQDPAFIPQLMYNWQSKYKTLYEDMEEAFAKVAMEVLLYDNPPKSRLITVKADSPQETKIKGYVNFRLRVKGRSEVLELLISGGAGLYNSIGMGCLAIEDSFIP